MGGGGGFRITGETGPPRGNPLVLVTNKKSKLKAEVKLFEAEIGYLKIYNNNNNNNNNNKEHKAMTTEPDNCSFWRILST
jgi:hypothetical protein